MTFSNFNKNHVEVLKKAIDDITSTKGVEYASSVDRFANFKRLAATLDMPADKILWVYFTKHLDALTTYLKKTPEERASGTLSEPIQGRVHDCIMYLILLDGLWEDLQDKLAEPIEKNIMGLHQGDKWNHRHSLLINYVIIYSYNSDTDTVIFDSMGLKLSMDRNEFRSKYVFMES